MLRDTVHENVRNVDKIRGIGVASKKCISVGRTRAIINQFDYYRRRLMLNSAIDAHVGKKLSSLEYYPEYKRIVSGTEYDTRFLKDTRKKIFSFGFKSFRSSVQSQIYKKIYSSISLRKRYVHEHVCVEQRYNVQ